MKHLLLCLAVLLAAGCAKESDLPTPGGKGSIVALNAIPASPTVAFRIEERDLGTLAYKASTQAARYDDFEYNFNFDAVLDAGVGTTRIASVPQKIEKDREYVFVLTGDIEAPDVLVWDAAERSWDGNETVFEFRFSNLAESLGPVDVYVAPPDVAPAAGAAVATLDYGAVSSTLDLPAEQDVVTVTRSGDPADILYQSLPTTFNEQLGYLLVLFDGDEVDVAPYTVRLLTSGGGAGTLPDGRFRPTLRFIQGDLSLPASDVYDDEMLTNRLAADLVFGAATGDISVPAGDSALTYTAAGNAGAILAEATVTAAQGSHVNVITYEDATNGDTNVRYYAPDRRSVSIYGKLSVFHASSNHAATNIFIVDPGQPIVTETLPRFQVDYSALSQTLALEAGTYDLYAAPAGSRTPFAGPTPLVVANGDVIEILLLDTTDPNSAEFRIFPAP